MDKLPKETAIQCDKRFPIKETIDTVAIVDSALLLDYEVQLIHLSRMIDELIMQDCDTVIREKIIEKIKNLPCKPEIKVITKTQESTAKVQVVKDSCDKLISSFVAINTNNVATIQKLELKNDKLKKQNSWLWIILIACGILIFGRQLLSLAKIAI